MSTRKGMGYNWVEMTVMALVVMAVFFSLYEVMGYYALIVVVLPFLMTSRFFAPLWFRPKEGSFFRDEDWIHSYLRVSPVLMPLSEDVSLPVAQPEGTSFWVTKAWAESRRVPGRIYGTVTYGLPDRDGVERGLFILWEPGPMPRLDGVYELGHGKYLAACGFATSIAAFFFLDRAFGREATASHHFNEWMTLVLGGSLAIGFVSYILLRVIERPLNLWNRLAAVTGGAQVDPQFREWFEELARTLRLRQLNAARSQDRIITFYSLAGTSRTSQQMLEEFSRIEARL